MADSQSIRKSPHTVYGPGTELVFANIPTGRRSCDRQRPIVYREFAPMKMGLVDKLSCPL